MTLFPHSFFMLLRALPWVFVCLAQVHALALVERRRFSLLPRGTGETGTPPPILGWALEERSTEQEPITSATWKFTVAWSGETEVNVQLPLGHSEGNDDVRTDDLSSSLWEASVAGAILCRSPTVRHDMSTQRVLELGSGLGLLGWTAAASAGSATLTDHDPRAVQLMESVAKRNGGNVTAQCLEWKDNHTETKDTLYDVIVASDVAYYFYLLRPLMDTIQAHMGNVVWIAGQANRQSQWDLYDNINNGCYNQLTDQREGPWPGQTRALLYNLHVGQWYTDATETDKVAKVLPILVIHHERTPSKDGDARHVFCEWDHIASSEDRKQIDISF